MRKAVQQQLQEVVLLWTLSWAIVGLGLGSAQLLRTGQVFWIPAILLGAIAAGLGVGILYAGLLLLTENWRDSLADTPGLVAKLGPHLLCGSGAGLIPGLLVGGFSGALFFGTLGACSAAVINWRSAKEAFRSRGTQKRVSNAKR